VIKASTRRDKYFLRELHQEIDFFDRKLADLEKYVTFSAPADRKVAEKQLLTKRAPLEKAARELAASGVEYQEKDLPRSFRLANQVPDATEHHPIAIVK